MGNIFKKLRILFTDPLRVIFLIVFKLSPLFTSDEVYLKLVYFFRIHKKLDLEQPRTFNEKLQWLKLYDRNPKYSQMVDKCEAKKYVANIISEKYIIPTLGVWDSFDDIDFDSLPNRFVLKCTHDSGGVVICRDKSELDMAAARKKINKFLNRDYYMVWREWPYKNLKPRIIAEKFMGSVTSKDLMDYKFMCFNGEVRCSFVCSERNTEDGLHVTFYDREWNKLPFQRHYPSSDKDFEKPKQYNMMIELAETLSKDIPFVRVDFYEINGHLYFGELTFYPGSGMEEFTPESWDGRLGSWLKLPLKEVKI